MEVVPFDVVVDPASLKPAASGPAVGLVHVKLGDVEFPSSTWDDFTEVILPWWSDAVLSLIRRDVDVAEWMFMDGPYQVRLTVAAHRRFRVDLLQLRHGGPVPVSSALVTESSVLRALRRATAAVLRQLSASNGKDEAELARTLALLNKAPIDG